MEHRIDLTDVALQQIRDEVAATGHRLAELTVSNAGRVAERVAEEVATLAQRFDADISGAGARVAAEVYELVDRLREDLSVEGVRVDVSAVTARLDRLTLRIDELEASGGAVRTALGQVAERLGHVNVALATAREDIARAASVAAAEPAGALRDGVASMLGLLTSVGERLAALERGSNLAANALSSQPEAVAAKVGDVMREQLAETIERIAVLDRRLIGLARSDQVASAMQEDRELARERFGAHAEQLQSLSSNVGAMYVRVRALEQSIERMRKDAADEKQRFADALAALKDVTTLEQRVAARIAARMTELLGSGDRRTPTAEAS
jgi:hypothetical protein